MRDGIRHTSLSANIYKSETLRNTNSFSKSSNQRDLREEPSAKQFATFTHKPDECGNVRMIPLRKLKLSVREVSFPPAVVKRPIISMNQNLYGNAYHGPAMSVGGVG